MMLWCSHERIHYHHQFDQSGAEDSPWNLRQRQRRQLCVPQQEQILPQAETQQSSWLTFKSNHHLVPWETTTCTSNNATPPLNLSCARSCMRSNWESVFTPETKASFAWPIPWVAAPNWHLELASASTLCMMTASWCNVCDIDGQMSWWLLFSSHLLCVGEQQTNYTKWASTPITESLMIIHTIPAPIIRRMEHQWEPFSKSRHKKKFIKTCKQLQV